MSSTPASYSTQDAALLVQLAGLANLSFGPGGQDLILPNGWNLLKTTTASGPGLTGLQAYFAMGNLPSTGKQVVVLCVGMMWQGLMDWYRSAEHQLQPLNGYFVADSAKTEKTFRGVKEVQDRLVRLTRLPLLEPAELVRQPVLAADLRRELWRLVQELTSSHERLIQAVGATARQAAGFSSAMMTLIQLCAGAADDIAEMERVLAHARGQSLTELALAVDSSRYEQLRKGLEAAVGKAHLEAMGLQGGGASTDGGGNSGSFDLGYQLLYGYLRGQLWPLLGFIGAVDLYVTGHGPAAPLAQLAALDLRPGKTGSSSPVTSVTVYGFSTPALGDEAFATWFAQQVPVSYTVLAEGRSLVDFFPTEPTQAQGYFQPSQLESLQASIPQYDDPWLERDSVFYTALLGGDTTTLAAASRTLHALSSQGSPATIAVLRERLLVAPGDDAPAGYNPDLSYTLAVLCSAAYERAQHPDLGTSLPSPWTLVTDVQAGGRTFVSIFSTPTQVAVVFRGAVTWEELFTLQGNYNMASGPSYLPPNAGQFSQGPISLYGQLRPALLQALQGISGWGSRQLLVTGHSMGGALATLCALDLQQGQQGLPVPAALYTFGAPPVGNPAFQLYFGRLAFAASTYRVVRPYDIVPRLTFQLSAAQAPATFVVLNGATDQDGATSHPITTYIELLDPQ
ncbi:lipase [Corallococcus coralloides DSM 2259]|uniref:Lipase n=1 Tax=Corallococcus coralloides (strain ATCC 25202 / DSM 2259 / NBRC 100086 / M2) TaxID=1144275 RepID=H8N2A4_CORCM|nr:lipase family protein [Corallococcus coralloides]AFE07209.1 lipase [Corallococcus coralloides DSM 2259]